MSNQIKGVVLEVNKHSCIIMTPEGKFQRVPIPNQPVKPGAEITCHQSNLSHSWLKSGAIAAILTLFLFGFSLYQTMLPTAVAYVSLDINPSIEMGVDKNSQVIKAKGLNDEGDNLLKLVSLKNKNVYLAIEELIAASIENNYLDPDQENLVFAAVTNETDAGTTVVEEELVYDTITRSAAKTPQVPVKVLVTEAKPEVQKEAQKNGVSTGKYLLYLDEEQSKQHRDKAKDEKPAKDNDQPKEREQAWEKDEDKYKDEENQRDLDKHRDQDKPEKSLKTLNKRSLNDLGIKQWEQKHPSAQKNNSSKLNAGNQNQNSKSNSEKQNSSANQNKTRDSNQKSGNRGQKGNN